MVKILFYIWLLKGNVVPNQDHTKYRFSFDEDVVCSYMNKEEFIDYMRVTIEEGSDIIDEEEFYLNN